jgi:hypothetical protein
MARAADPLTDPGLQVRGGARAGAGTRSPIGSGDRTIVGRPSLSRFESTRRHVGTSSRYGCRLRGGCGILVYGLCGGGGKAGMGVVHARWRASGLREFLLGEGRKGAQDAGRRCGQVPVHKGGSLWSVGAGACGKVGESAKAWTLAAIYEIGSRGRLATPPPPPNRVAPSSTAWAAARAQSDATAKHSASVPLQLLCSCAASIQARAMPSLCKLRLLSGMRARAGPRKGSVSIPTLKLAPCSIHSPVSSVLPDPGICHEGAAASIMLQPACRSEHLEPAEVRYQQLTLLIC